ncbi:MAG: DUF1700 domain-containing protein [Bacteroidetes bacterium]|nr:DUF1700 domain-containing protein [Bacteroidota bacterium]
MTEQKFILSLKDMLQGISKVDKEEILDDYREHFLAGREKGKSDTEIAQSLGELPELVKAIKAEYFAVEAVKKGSPGRVFRAVFAAAGLSFFNLIFILSPFLGVFALLLGLWSGAFAMVVSGTTTMLAIILRPILESIVPIIYENFSGFFWNFAFFLAAVFIASVGGIWSIGMVHLSKLFFKGTAKYVRLNVQIITGKGGAQNE